MIGAIHLRSFSSHTKPLAMIPRGWVLAHMRG
jgi:hypothetical protein